MSLVARFKGSYKFFPDRDLKVCILPISVGQPYHEEEMFAATLQLVNKIFEKCIIVVCDLLQRHNQLIYNPSFSEEEAYEKSFILGNNWIERNQKYLNQLSIPYEISRWRQWLDHPLYNQRRQEISNLYKVDKEFKEVIDQTVQIFYERFIKRTYISWESFFMRSKEYVEEECTIMPFWMELHPSVMVYPKNIGKALTLTLKRFVIPDQTGLLQPLSLKFKKKNLDYTKGVYSEVHEVRYNAAA